MEALKQNKKRIISLKQAKNLLILLIFVFLFNVLLFPMPTLASQAVEEDNIIAVSIIEEKEEIELRIINHLPENDIWQVKSTSIHAITAYNSEIGQTDDSPCITANGFNVCQHGIEDTLAANFLEFGTKVRVPELFGDKVFTIRDRMNKRYSNRLDVWMVRKIDAKTFGVQVAKIEVLE